ncbi:hypothetical protein ABGB18_25870 [Nonomuraea sp. B12E4]|uniref:hypothetical protein n=1 Tax=Nonomuraea sp. B12E4 TaxID=3153564 RepID=UPI00325D6969
MIGFDLHHPRPATFPAPVAHVPATGIRSLLAAMRASVRAFWDEATGYQRLAYLVGAALMVVGLAHAAIWMVVGGSAEGALSWRKPMTFGLSFGLTTATLAWVGGHLPVGRRIGWVVSAALCASTTLEVAWVVLQHARGVASHFNDATPLDETLFVGGGVTIGVTLVVVVLMTLASFVRTSAPPAMALALRAGLVSLLVAMAVGGWMIINGNELLDADVSPLTQSMTTYGAAGVMKLAHAVPMHGIQFFGVLAWLLTFSGLPARRRLSLVALAVAGFAGLFGVVLMRTVSGLAPFTPMDASLGVYLAPIGLLATAGSVTLAAVWRHARGI